MKLNALATGAALTLLSQTAFAYGWGICNGGTGAQWTLKCYYSHDSTDYLDIESMDWSCQQVGYGMPPPPYANSHVLRTQFTTDRNSHSWEGKIPAGCVCSVWKWKNYLRIDWWPIGMQDTLYTMSDRVVGQGPGCPPCQ